MMQTPDLYSPRTENIIGRDSQINAIRQAILSPISQEILYIVGPGGIGKTRLLEEIATIQAGWQHRPFFWSGIIDLYHTDYHTPEELRHAIVCGLDPEKQHFPRYYLKHESLEQLEEKESQESQQQINKERRKINSDLDKIFREEYKQLSRSHRLVLTFDTVEVMQFDMLSQMPDREVAFYEICGVKQSDKSIKVWLLSEMLSFANSVVILAGRAEHAHQRLLAAELFDRFANQPEIIDFKIIKLEAFDESQSKKYLEALAQERPDLAQVIENPRYVSRLQQICRGTPILLALLADVLLIGLEESASLSWLFPVDEAVRPPDPDPEELVNILMNRFRRLPPPISFAFTYLAQARKGLDKPLLTYLLHDGEAGATKAEIDNIFDKLRGLAIVKYREKKAQLFFHDEIYDLLDQYYKDDLGEMQEINRELVAYYRQKLLAAKTPVAEEDGKVTLLYYQLRLHPGDGCYKYYSTWTRQAIVNGANELDMRLREEVLRFVRRYVLPDGQAYNHDIAKEVNREMLERELAVQWIRRYFHQSRRDEANQSQLMAKAECIAEELYKTQDRVFNRDLVDDVCYEADLLTIWGQIMIFASVDDEADPREQAINKLKSAIALLKNREPVLLAHFWRHKQILGNAQNLLGYLYRTQLQYGLARQNYGEALSAFRARPDYTAQKKDANDTWIAERQEGDALILLALQDNIGSAYRNSAFNLLFLRRHNLALDHIQEALALYRGQVARQTLYAYSLSTLGQVHTYRHEYDEAFAAFRQALDIFESRSNERGKGLVLTGLGFSSRKRANRWKYDKKVAERAEGYFRKAIAYLEEAEQIFSDRGEQDRLWEALNELGSVYCDWAWLARHQDEGDAIVMNCYISSFETQRRALEIALKYGLLAQKFESYEDLAQVYGDLSFFLLKNGQRVAARQRRAQAQAALQSILEDDDFPEVFKRVSAQDFSLIPVPGDAYWLSLIKINHWQGVWSFRDILMQNVNEADIEDTLQTAVEKVVWSVIFTYFYWPDSFKPLGILKRFLHYFRHFQISNDDIRRQIEAIGKQYPLPERVLRDSIYSLRRLPDVSDRFDVQNLFV